MSIINNEEPLFGGYYTAESSNLTTSMTKARSNPYLLDNISNHYIFEEEVHMSFNILRKYEHIIRNNIIEVPMKNDWLFKPEYCSYAYYGTTDFWYLVMFVNNITKPMEFNMETIKLVSQDFVSDVFKNIINKEANMLKSLTYPTMIYKHTLKSLNSKSKRVLPSDFNSSIDSLFHYKQYEDKTALTSLENYKNESNLMINGILRTSFKKGYGKNIVRPVYKNYVFNANYENIDFYGEENYFPGGYIDELGKSKEKILTITKEGKLKVPVSGTYYFKVISCGNFAIYINHKNILNSNTLDFINENKAKNYIEEYSLNSDFKRRNFYKWTIGGRAGLASKTANNSSAKKEVDKLVYDDYLNKEVLVANCDNPKVLYSYMYNTLDNNNLICEMTIPKSEIGSFENNGDFIFIVDYDVLSKHPNDSKKARYNKFIGRLQITYNNGEKFDSIKETSEYKEFPIISDAEDKELYYKKPLHEVFIYGQDEMPQSKDNIKTITVSLYMGEFSANTKNKIETLPKIQYGISKLSLITLNSNTNEKGIYLDKNKWYDFESMLTKRYYDTDYFYFKYECNTRNNNYFIPPESWFWYNMSVKEDNARNTTINGTPYPRKALAWESLNYSANKVYTSGILNNYLNFYNTNNYSFPMLFELSIFDTTDEDNIFMCKQLLTSQISLKDKNIYEFFGLSSSKEYKLVYRIPNLLYRKKSNQNNSNTLDYILVDNAYSEGKYTINGVEDYFTKNWYRTGIDLTGTIRIKANKNTRISLYRVTHYEKSNSNTALNYPYENAKLLGSNNYQENIVTFTIEERDILTDSTKSNNAIVDLFIEVSLRNGQTNLGYEIDGLFNEYSSSNYQKIDDIFKYLTTTDNPTLKQKGINNPAYFLDYPLSLPLSYTHNSLDSKTNNKIDWSISPYNPSYNSIYKLINKKFNLVETKETISEEEYDSIEKLLEELKKLILNSNNSDDIKSKLLFNMICQIRFKKNSMIISDIIETINNRFNTTYSEDMWIYRIHFNKVQSNSVNIDGTKPFDRMRGIFGFFLNYENENKSYLIIWNFYQNNEFIKSGLYKFDGTLSLKEFNTAMNYSIMTSKFKLIQEIPKFNGINCLIGKSKEFCIMKYNDYILIREDNNKEPFLTYRDTNKPLSGGTIGYFSYQIEGLNFSTKLYK